MNTRTEDNLEYFIIRPRQIRPFLTLVSVSGTYQSGTKFIQEPSTILEIIARSHVIVKKCKWLILYAHCFNTRIPTVAGHS